MNIDDLFDAYLVDLDGVVYVGEEAVAGVPSAIAALRRRGKPILFLTNDPRGARADFAAKLTRLGVPATADDVLTSTAATAAYIAERHDVAGRTVFAIGTYAFKSELANVGLRVLEGYAGRAADFVVLGCYEGFNYWEVLVAGQAARRGAYLYATNRDPVFPMPDGLWPATGVVVAAVEAAAGKTAVAVGKPEVPMFAVAKKMLPAAARLAIVGDRLDSDILGGKRAGIGTILVLSGGTSAAEAASADIQPDFVLPSLAGLV